MPAGSGGCGRPGRGAAAPAPTTTTSARAQRRAGRRVSVVALDGARRIGAKILVSGGGRCNVTHWQVTARDYAGSTPPAIRNVLGRFGVAETVEFFRAQGVEFYREADTGKLFPTTDSARTILDALLVAAREAGVRLVHPAAVTAIERAPAGFHLTGPAGVWQAARVVLATGGCSLPKSGSDGLGFRLAAALGHSLARPIVPALVPLVLPGDHWIRSLSGLALPCRFRLVSGAGKVTAESVGSTLCTHTGLSGPATLDISRHWLVSRVRDPDARLVIDWLPAVPAADLESQWFVQRMIMGGQIEPFDFHKTGFSFTILCGILRGHGFDGFRRVKSFGLFKDTSIVNICA
ncbi:MAG: aminoacetone oxidase family FAD-binding enzyme [Planctomycetia bacterium]|nr:aminoacetone oxidase family FAD-binding enzyme [Planctomycetia bacterium]